VEGVRTGGRDLLGRAADAARDASGDLPTALERVAVAMGARGALVVRCVGRAVVGDVAYLRSEEWTHRTAVVPDIAPEAMDAMAADAVVRSATHALRVPDGCGWHAGRSPGEPFVAALYEADLLVAGSVMDALAAGLSLAVGRDLATAGARVDGLLRERARIASEIHQGVCQEIATLILQLQVLGEVLHRDSPSARTLLTEIERSAQLCAEHLRSAIAQLTPVVPDTRWLDGGLQRFISDFCEASGVSIDLELVGPMRAIDPDPLALIFAFVQEGLTNMRKHSPSTRGTVRIGFGERTVRAEVIDHRGPNANVRCDPMATPFGHGLMVMRSRARLLGGHVELVRVGRSGTRLSLEVPA
jgi:signal transduction histidine kinase